MVNKHMLNNKFKGFTLIETIFTLSIIILLSSITVFYSNYKGNDSLLLNFNTTKLINTLQKVKVESNFYRKSISIDLFDHFLIINGKDQKKVMFNKDIFITGPKIISFNTNSNVNKATTINICKQKNCKKIIVNLGSGNIYVKD